MSLGSEEGMENRLAINFLMIVILTILLCVVAIISDYKANHEIKTFTIEVENGNQTINTQTNR